MNQPKQPDESLHPDFGSIKVSSDNYHILYWQNNTSVFRSLFMSLTYNDEHFACDSNEEALIFFSGDINFYHNQDTKSLTVLPNINVKGRNLLAMDMELFLVGSLINEPYPLRYIMIQVTNENCPKIVLSYQRNVYQMWLTELHLHQKKFTSKKNHLLQPVICQIPEISYQTLAYDPGFLPILSLNYDQISILQNTSRQEVIDYDL